MSSSETNIRIVGKPAWMITDAPVDVYLNGRVIGSGSIKNGFTIEEMILPGPHLLKITQRALLNLHKSTEYSFTAPLGANLVIDCTYDRVWTAKYKCSHHVSPESTTTTLPPKAEKGFIERNAPIWRENMQSMFNRQLKEPVIRLGIVGRGNSGKTCVMNAIRRTVFRGTPINQRLYFGTTAHETVVQLHLSEAHDKVAQAGPVIMTTAANNFQCSVYEGAKPVMHFVYQDAIGQLLAMVELGEEDNKKHAGFISQLIGSDVLWAVLPIRMQGKEAYLDPYELQTVLAYAREAIGEKPDTNYVSVAIVLSKADTAGIEGSSQMKDNLDRVSNQALQVFRPLIEYEPKIWASCVFPVSAFGLGNAEEREVMSATSKEQARAWVLTSESSKPWNVDKLLLWSLVCGLNQPQSRRQNGTESNRISSQIMPALESNNGPVLVVKAMRQ